MFKPNIWTNADWNDALYDDEDYSQRLTSKQWRSALLNHEDKIMTKGTLRQLVAKNLGCGVIEISKAPLEDTHEHH